MLCGPLWGSGPTPEPADAAAPRHAIASVPIVKGRQPAGEPPPKGAPPMIDTARRRRSAWRVSTSGASYSLARGHLDRRVLPPAGNLRIEDFANAFEIADPGLHDALRLTAEVFVSPARPDRHLLHVALHGARVERPSTDLVVVVELSRTAEGPEPQLLTRSLEMLVAALDERDRLGLVAHGPRGRVVLEPTRLVHRPILEKAVAALVAGPSSRPFEALLLGYDLLERTAAPHRSQRLFLYVEGALKLDDEALPAVVRRQAHGGRTLSTFSFAGRGHDPALERLARDGGGVHAVVDHPTEARRQIAGALAGGLEVVAREVTGEIELRPEAVARYRLLSSREPPAAAAPAGGNRDAVIGAGASAGALYEIQLTSDRSGPIGTVRVRYRPAAGGPVRTLERPLAAAPRAGSSPARLAWIAATFGEKLSGSYWAGETAWGDLLRSFSELDPGVRTDPRTAELRYLIRRAEAFDRRRALRTSGGTAAFDDLRILASGALE